VHLDFFIVDWGNMSVSSSDPPFNVSNAPPPRWNTFHPSGIAVFAYRRVVETWDHGHHGRSAIHAPTDPANRALRLQYEDPVYFGV